jgi:hypothetical protein
MRSPKGGANEHLDESRLREIFRHAKRRVENALPSPLSSPCDRFGGFIRGRPEQRGDIGGRVRILVELSGGREWHEAFQDKVIRQAAQRRRTITAMILIVASKDLVIKGRPAFDAVARSANTDDPLA